MGDDTKIFEAAEKVMKTQKEVLLRLRISELEDKVKELEGMLNKTYPSSFAPEREWWIRKIKDVPGGQAFSTEKIAVFDGVHPSEEIVHVREVLDQPLMLSPGRVDEIFNETFKEDPWVMSPESERVQQAVINVTLSTESPQNVPTDVEIDEESKRRREVEKRLGASGFSLAKADHDFKAGASWALLKVRVKPDQLKVPTESSTIDELIELKENLRSMITEAKLHLEMYVRSYKREPYDTGSMLAMYIQEADQRIARAEATLKSTTK